MQVKADELLKIDLKIDTSGLYHRCHNCKNVIAVGNVDDFAKNVREFIENSLIANNGVEGEIETSFYFACPACLAGNYVGLNFNLTNQRQVMYFKGKLQKRPILDVLRSKE